jgi:hypothetical protein
MKEVSTQGPLKILTRNEFSPDAAHDDLTGVKIFIL